MKDRERLHFESDHATRRRFLRMGAAGALASGWGSLSGQSEALPPDLSPALESLEPYFTPQEKFRDVSRGRPLPHSLSDGAKRAAGLTRETWRLEVVPDSQNPARLRSPLTKADGTALDFSGLMKLAEKHAVRFAKTMTCLNIGCPLGTGIWEGVPLRHVVWLTQPRENLRRVVYHGYHHDDPQQMFRSSLPIDRVLEDPFDLPPVILCYKLNGEWLNSERGGPVRVVVPEAYGFKSIKWLTRVELTNLYHANDTYAEGNNDVDSSLKTFAATFPLPREIKANEPVPITGYAQVGISGLSKVQVVMQLSSAAGSSGGVQPPQWTDARILPPPGHWGAVAEGRIPADTQGFDPITREPLTWPMRLTKVHWSALWPGLPPGKYTLRSRTIDGKGNVQPMPRPFPKSGHAAIESVEITVKS